MIILYSFFISILSWALYPAIMKGIQYWYPFPKLVMEGVLLTGMASPIFATVWIIIGRVL